MQFWCSMGSSAVLLQPFTPQIAPLSSPSAVQRMSATRCHFSARYGGRSSDGSQRDRATRSNEQPKFDDYNGENDVFGFSSAAKQRVWWSDDDDESSWNTDYYEDYDDDDNGFGSFGVLGGSIGFAWIFKLVQAFGWMVPAITISMLLGTGPNAIIMAFALPIAQSALSLVLDTFWEGPSEFSSARPESRTKKRPSTWTASNSEVRERKETYTQTTNKVRDYHSWVAADHVSGKKGEGSTHRFGGWDELDKQGRTDQVPKRTTFQNASGPRKQKKSKLSKRVRKRDSPLLIRLLISVFPFFGFWTKLF